MPMYMYGTAILILISQSEENSETLRKIPRAGIIISTSIYLILATLSWIFRENISLMFTDKTEVVSQMINLMLFLLIAHIFNPVSTVYKYSLQAVGESKFVLFRTAAINIVTFLVMIAFIYGFKLGIYGIYGIFISLFLNYFILYLIYKIKFTHKMSHTKVSI